MGKRKSNKRNRGTGTGNLNKMINKVNRDYMTKIETLSLEVSEELFDECLDVALEHTKAIEMALELLYSHLKENDYEPMLKNDFGIVADAFYTKMSHITSKKIVEEIKKEIANKIFYTCVKREAEQLMDDYAEQMGKIPMSYDRLSKETYRIEYAIRTRLLKVINVVLGDVFSTYDSYLESLCLAMNDFMDKHTKEDKEEIVEIAKEIEPREDEVHIMKVTDRKELIELAQDNGYVFKSQRGSHMKFEDSNGKIVIIPMHSNDCGIGLSYGIQKQIFNK